MVSHAATARSCTQQSPCCQGFPEVSGGLRHSSGLLEWGFAWLGSLCIVKKHIFILFWTIIITMIMKTQHSLLFFTVYSDISKKSETNVLTGEVSAMS